MNTLFIRIVMAPFGDTPLWVREKWVGLVLPVATKTSQPIRAHAPGFSTGPRIRLAALWWNLRGRPQWEIAYAVDANEALTVLERVAPHAASWWRENFPQLRARKRMFLFHAFICERVR